MFLITFQIIWFQEYFRTTVKVSCQLLAWLLTPATNVPKAFPHLDKIEIQNSKPFFKYFEWIVVIDPPSTRTTERERVDNSFIHLKIKTSSTRFILFKFGRSVTFRVFIRSTRIKKSGEIFLSVVSWVERDPVRFQQSIFLIGVACNLQ